MFSKLLKLGTFLFLLLGNILTTQAQTSHPMIEWERKFGIKDDCGSTFGSYQINALEYSHTPNQYIAIGNSGNSHSFIYLTEITDNGDTLWQKHIDSNILANNIKQTPNGYIICGSYNDDGLILEVDMQGNELWRKLFSGTDSEIINDITLTADGGYILVGGTNSNDGDFIGNIESFTGNMDIYGSTYKEAFVIKLESSRTISWIKYYGGSDNDNFYSIVLADDGGYLISGSSFSTDRDLINRPMTHEVHDWVQKIDEQGNTSWNKFYFSYQYKNRITKTNDGGYIITGTNIHRLDILGNEIFSTNVPLQLNYGSNYSNVIVDAQGNYIAVGFDHNFNNSPDLHAKITYFNSNGALLWEQKINLVDYQISFFSDILVNNNNEYIVSGFGHDCYLGYIGKVSGPPKGYVSGCVYIDTDTNCIQQTSSVDSFWVNRMVKITDGTGNEYFQTTDVNGQFSVPVWTTGTMGVTPILPWFAGFPSCYVPTYLTTTDTTPSANFPCIPVSVIHNCPSMQVSNATGFLRRCFTNYSYVSYKNDGFAVANNVYVDITLDENMTFINSSLPSTDLGNNVRRFQLGNVAGETDGNFSYNVYLACGDSTILGQTHCVTAHIYPDVPCIAVPSSANLEINATCEGDSIAFLLKNTSNAAMLAPINSYVYEEEVLLMAIPVQLPANGTYLKRIATNGQSTYRLELANPMADMPNGTMWGARVASAAVEGCNATTTFNTGNITPYSTPDDQPWLDINCEQNRGSYDPNDKTGMPAGLGENHDITANDAIEYKIRFQNTGTDTAFTVVIRDTLDVDLDAATIEFGAGSHAYTPQINGQGAIKFTFTNILLPDSNTNEPASNGFVSFRIKQKANNPVGTVIHNTAAIYFDFNPPVITNTTTHTINNFNRAFTLSILPTKNSLISIKAYPNPFTESTTLDLGEKNLSNVRFTLYDMTGKIVKQQTYENTNQIILQKENLTEGIYLYTIYHEGKAVATGKLVVK